ncbi:hypothetical protein N7478_011779 [Penicillium angulare]|uniref:uncharacterized protein n=1 Tax=Penicillium angulare TaxID=116970 RepID=UPI00253F683F|nr:uncharacterized protein N7478_011779 [Penicillium angulare]KAJ5261184.1 hypothetical protein N7478_011779 [Penicillium angulare]
MTFLTVRGERPTYPTEQNIPVAKYAFVRSVIELFLGGTHYDVMSARTTPFPNSTPHDHPQLASLVAHQRRDAVPISTSTISVSSADEEAIQPGPDSTVLEDRDSEVKHYVELYFSHFHQHWPILHHATFSIPDEPPLLVQAVMIIGLWVSDKPSAQQAAVDLHDRLGFCIRDQMVEWENPLPRTGNEGDGLVSKCPIATYQGILLYLIFSLVQNSNNRSLRLGLSLSSSDHQILSALVQVCLRNKVFHYPDMLERYEGDTPMACIWVGMEEMSRLGLAIYKVSTLCKSEDSNNNECRLLQLSDLQFPVPNSRHLWEAESNQELARLLKLDGNRERLDIYTPQNWISTSAKTLESGSERWWL